jgi:hypothetical protein
MNLHTAFVQCKLPREAIRHCPWATVFVKSGDGYICYGSRADYDAWRTKSVQPTANEDVKVRNKVILS